MIRKKKDGYRVLSEKGKNLGGPYKTKKEARKRLRQVEYFTNTEADLDRAQKEQGSSIFSTPLPSKLFSAVGRSMRFPTNRKERKALEKMFKSFPPKPKE
jgi:hypothetical protein